MTIELNLCDKTLRQRKNRKHFVKNYFTADSVWIAYFVCILASFSSVSSLHLSLRGEGNVNILVKGAHISIDVNSADSTFEQSDINKLPCKLDGAMAQIEAKVVNTNPQIERRNTKSVTTTENFDRKKSVLEAIWEDNETQTMALLGQFYGNINGDEDLRPLTFAAERCKLKVAEVLITNGADLNIAGRTGWRPIHVATYAGCIEIVRMLIEKGADLNAKIGIGYSALDIAKHDGHKEIAQLLSSTIIGRTEGTSEDESDTSEGDLYTFDKDSKIESTSESTWEAVSDTHEDDSSESISEDNSYTSEGDLYSSEQESSESASEEYYSVDQSKESSSIDKSQNKGQMGETSDRRNPFFYYKVPRNPLQRVSGDESDIDMHYVPFQWSHNIRAIGLILH